MFRDLGNLFERKKRLLSKSEDISIKITDIVHRFLNSQFGNSPQDKLFNIIYKSQEGTLLIEAANKILANELSLRLGELYSQLQEAKINLNKILIR